MLPRRFRTDGFIDPCIPTLGANYLGEIDTTEAATRKLVTKLAAIPSTDVLLRGGTDRLQTLSVRAVYLTPPPPTYSVRA
jgi:hypothetical protein